MKSYCAMWGLCLVALTMNGCFIRSNVLDGSQDSHADIKNLLADDEIEDSTPLSEVVVMAECKHPEGKSCMRWKDAKLECYIAEGRGWTASNTVFSMTNTLLTLFRPKNSISEAVLWPDHRSTVKDMSEQAPKLNLACYTGMFGIPGKREGAAKTLLDESALQKIIRPAHLALNKDVLNRGACYFPKWGFVKGDWESEIIATRCDNVSGYKYKNLKNRIEITFKKISTRKRGAILDKLDKHKLGGARVNQ